MTRKYPNTRPKRIATLPCENVCAQKSGKTVKQTAMLSISVFVFFLFSSLLRFFGCVRQNKLDMFVSTWARVKCNS